MFSRKIKQMRTSADFMRHIANEAERTYQAPGPVTAADFSEKEIVDMMRSIECSRETLRHYTTSKPVPSEPVTREEAIAHLIETEQMEREDAPAPLHMRLRETAQNLIEEASALEALENTVENLDSMSSELLDEAKKADWYDDAYTGFCESEEFDRGC